MQEKLNKRICTIQKLKPRVETILCSSSATVETAVRECMHYCGFKPVFPVSGTAMDRLSRPEAMVFFAESGSTLETEPVLRRIEQGVPFVLSCLELPFRTGISQDQFSRLLKKVPPNLIVLTRIEVDRLLGALPLPEASRLEEHAGEGDAEICRRAAAVWHTGVMLLTEERIFVSDGKFSVTADVPSSAVKFLDADIWLTLLAASGLAVNSEELLVSVPAATGLFLSAATSCCSVQGAASMRNCILDKLSFSDETKENAVPLWRWQ